MLQCIGLMQQLAMQRQGQFAASAIGTHARRGGGSDLSHKRIYRLTKMHQKLTVRVLWCCLLFALAA